MSDEAFGFETIAELAAAFASGELGPVDYTTRLLARIEALDPALGAFVSLNRERALAEAQAAEDAITRGTAGPLAGVPYAAKDIFDVAGDRPGPEPACSPITSRRRTARRSPGSARPAWC